jgi:hypothetical protein
MKDYELVVEFEKLREKLKKHRIELTAAREGFVLSATHYINDHHGNPLESWDDKNISTYLTLGELSTFCSGFVWGREEILTVGVNRPKFEVDS